MILSIVKESEDRSRHTFALFLARSRSLSLPRDVVDEIDWFSRLEG